MTDLSPQAQEVFWAFNRAASGKPDDWHYLPAIAAALQSVADQVVPHPIRLPRNSYAEGAYDKRLSDRQKLLAAA